MIDLHKVDWAVLAPVWERPIVMHNAAFDLGYLAQRGIEPVGVDCTLQAVRLLNGPNATSLETAAASYFGLALDKALQTSDWGAKHLSLAQVTYAADDAVVTWWLAETVLPLLGERRTAYDIQVGAIPAVVRMQLRGILLDATAHAALIAALKAERARLADVYAAACEEAGRPDLRRAGVPDNAPAIEALLAGLLDGAGAAGLAADAEERQAQHPAGRPRRGRGRLSAAQGAGRHRPDREAAQHLWRAPGGADLADDRPHPRLLQDRRRDLRPQHLQQAEHAEHPRRAAGRGVAELPDAVRGAAGLCLRRRRLVLDGDAGGRAHRGGRGHDAGLRARRGPARAHREDHARARRGRLAGPARGRAQAASQARQAGEFRPALRARGRGSRRLGAGAVRPDPRPGHSEGVDQGLSRRPIPTSRAGAGTFARACERSGRIPIGREGGRVHEIHWNPDGYRYTQCLNLPIQGACADAFMLALATIDAALFEAGIEGGPVAAPHDEIVLEVPRSRCRAGRGSC